MTDMEYVNQAQLTKTDFVMLGIMLVVSLGIGVFFAVSGNKNKTKIEYLLGNRRLGVIPVCLSLFATFHSAIGLLGLPAEVYSYGTMTVYGSMAIPLSYLIGIFTVVPLVHPLKITSLYEYLEIRFHSRGLRLLGTLTGVISSISYMTVALWSPALALQTAVDLPMWLSIVLVGGVGTIYTAIGGIKSVVWTDVFQTAIVFGGIIFVLIKGSSDVGGIETVWKIASENGRIVFDDFDSDFRVRHTVWGLLIGGTIYWLTCHFSQSSVQRIVATRSQTHARLTYMATIPLTILNGAIMVMTGLVLVAYFFSLGCDPLKIQHIKNRNQLMPYFVMHSLSFLPGLPGLYMATIFSGALSTLSSGINSLTANTVEDFLGGVLANKRESTVTAISKIIVCLYGTGIIMLAYLAREMPGPVTQTTHTALGATAAPLLGVFLLAATFPQANALGTGFGLIAGLAVSLWLTIGSFMYGVSTPQLPYGPVDKCISQNVTSASWNSSFIDQKIEVSSTVSSYTTPYSSTVATNASVMERTSLGTFSLYDMSYLWFPVVGLVVTLISGLLTSIIYGAFQKKKHIHDARLFFPFARWLFSMDAVTDEKELKTRAHFISKSRSAHAKP